MRQQLLSWVTTEQTNACNQCYRVIECIAFSIRSGIEIELQCQREVIIVGLVIAQMRPHGTTRSQHCLTYGYKEGAVDEKAFGKEISCGAVGAIALLKSRLEMADILGFGGWQRC